MGPKGQQGNVGDKGDTPIIKDISLTDDKKIKFIIYDGNNIYEVISNNTIPLGPQGIQGERGPVGKTFVDLNWKQESVMRLDEDNNNNLTIPNRALKENLKTYLSQYRMITDGVNVKEAFIINIGVNFEIIVRPNYNNRLILNNCLTTLQDYFNIDKWQVNQPIILPSIYSLLDQVEGVQTVDKVEIVNKSGINNNYSQYSYDIKGATINNIVYPSLDPSIFEVKFPLTDIQGRCVTF